MQQASLVIIWVEYKDSFGIVKPLSYDQRSTVTLLLSPLEHRFKFTYIVAWKRYEEFLQLSIE